MKKEAIIAVMILIVFVLGFGVLVKAEYSTGASCLVDHRGKPCIWDVIDYADMNDITIEGMPTYDVNCAVIIADTNFTENLTINADGAVDILLIGYDYTPNDLCFSGDGADVIFQWRDGKFNVVYDANNCTQAAQAFLDYLLPYLNVYIEDKAKEIKDCPEVLGNLKQTRALMEQVKKWINIADELVKLIDVQKEVIAAQAIKCQIVDKRILEYISDMEEEGYITIDGKNRILLGDPSN